MDAFQKTNPFCRIAIHKLKPILLGQSPLLMRQLALKASERDELRGVRLSDIRTWYLIPINTGDSWITYSYHEDDREKCDTLRENEISEKFFCELPVFLPCSQGGR